MQFSSRNLFFILIFFQLNSANLFAQSLTFPFSAKVEINGVVDSAEWAAADSVSIRINSSRKTVIYFIKDSFNLNFAFIGDYLSQAYFPEIVIDTDRDGGTSFQPDDWWFHVSATDCEFKGTYGNYDNCQQIRPNWKAEPNGIITDTIEIAIPDSTIGISMNDTIGISFLLNNFQNVLSFPPTANHLSPSTWSNAIFSNIVTGINHEQTGVDTDEFKIYPNPSKGVFKLKLNASNDLIHKIQVLSISGKLLMEKSLNNKSYIGNIDLSEYGNGLYFLIMHLGENSLVKKIIKY